MSQHMFSDWVMPPWMEQFRTFIQIPPDGISVESCMRGQDFYNSSVVMPQVLLLAQLHSLGKI